MIDQRWHTVRIRHERSADDQDAQPGREYEKRGWMTPVPEKQRNPKHKQSSLHGKQQRRVEYDVL